MCPLGRHGLRVLGCKARHIVDCLLFPGEDAEAVRVQQAEWIKQNQNLLSPHPISQKKQQPGPSAVEAAGTLWPRELE